MDVYHYDDNGVYTRTSTMPRLPGKATTVAPPSMAANQTAIWDGSSWSLASDFRGDWYDKATGLKTTVSEVNVAQPANTVSAAPPDTGDYSWDETGGEWVVDYTRLRAIKKLEIDAVYKQKCCADYTHSSYTYAMDDHNYWSFMGMAANAGQTSFTVRDTGDTERSLTDTDVKDIVKAVYTRNHGHKETKRTKYNAVDALTDDANTIKNYDASTGW